MTIRVLFQGGPLNGEIGRVANLPQLQLFFSPRQRQVFCYKRTDELVYSFDMDLSNGLTQKYDESFEKFGKDAASVVRWEKPKPRLTNGGNVV